MSASIIIDQPSSDWDLKMMHELVVNLHMHTSYSDGTGTHDEIAHAALNAGLDAVIVTDHNVLVNGLERYYRNGDRQLLLLIGEEVHNPVRVPQKSHLLIFGPAREMAAFAEDPQRLIECVQQEKGVSFLAHPVEVSAPVIGEPDLSWEDWEVSGFTGLELWNAMSELKSKLRSRLHAVFYALNPRFIASGPSRETLAKWDEMLAEGRPVVVVGGTDAHAFLRRFGPFRLTLFPYEFHFRTVNTHLLVPEQLTGDLATDRRTVLEALRAGHAFIGYDLPASTRGFRFSAQGRGIRALMGDRISAENGVTLQIRLPRRTECRLIRDGRAIRIWRDREICTYITSEPGIYRVEVAIQYLGRKRSWIYSNPIYVLD